MLDWIEVADLVAWLEFAMFVPLFCVAFVHHEGLCGELGLMSPPQSFGMMTMFFFLHIILKSGCEKENRKFFTT